MNPAAAFKDIPAAVLGDLQRRYAEPKRHYHTWAHIEALLGWCEAREDALTRPDGVRLAILFHDAVYDPMRSDNEALSAELLEGADLPGVAAETRRFAIQAVLATATHTLPDDLDPAARGDAAEFLDMDLSILASPPHVFDRYEDQVRAEYAHVPEPLFRAGRRQMLKRFADRERLYFSDWGFGAFEYAARTNLARSMAKLAEQGA